MYNPEIDWETGEIKIMRCLPMYEYKVKIFKREKI